MVQVLFTDTSTPQNWVVPAGVFNVMFETVGGGGSSVGQGGSGGAGGGYARTTLVVQPGTQFRITVGAGGSYTTGTSGNQGGTSTVTNSDGTVTIASASGGYSNGSQGGQGLVGDIKFNGGRGSASSGTNGGAGGGAGGSAGNGGAASGTTGGAAGARLTNTVTIGRGGYGYTKASNGSLKTYPDSGGNYGGGAAVSFDSNAMSYPGQGVVRVYYETTRNPGLMLSF